MKPKTIQLKDYDNDCYLEALAFGDLFCSINGWEVVSVELHYGGLLARVVLWHDAREWTLLMRSDEWIDCAWVGDYWIQVDIKE